MLGVSRPPLREAIRQLEAEGLLTSSPRRGSYVRTFDGDEVRELYSLRYAIEAAAAEYVALEAQPETIALLERMLLEIEEASSEGDPAVIRLYGRGRAYQFIGRIIPSCPNPSDGKGDEIFCPRVQEPKTPNSRNWTPKIKNHKS